ncbi:uncharacterized protein LOC120351823 [Nilaparvata lugens]|uniref:uncharacterized protein LOC120351823 n=1 Tax=Nilaparvata lugens TaxID=108931 RepID=UPI00193CC37B|nr:uncharacterized protein LOC120351823 [Nilaparvata lugens]
MEKKRAEFGASRVEKIVALARIKSLKDSASELHQVVRRKTASQSRDRAGFSQKPIYSSQHSVNNDSIDNIIIEDYFDQADTDQFDFALNLPTISEVGFEMPTTEKAMDLILVQSELEVKSTVEMMVHVPDEIEILGVSTEDKAIENVPDENELELLTTDETMAHIQVQSGFEVPTTDKAMDLKLVQGELEVKSTGEMMAHVPDEIEILGVPTVDKRIENVSDENELKQTTTDKTMVQSELEDTSTVNMMALIPNEIEMLGVSTIDKTIDDVTDENELVDMMAYVSDEIEILDVSTVDKTIEIVSDENELEQTTTDKTMVQSELEESADQTMEQEGFLSDKGSTENSDDDFNVELSKRKRNEGSKRLLNKKLRMKGEAYIGFQKCKESKKNVQTAPKKERKLGENCSSAFCAKTRMCNKITNEERSNLFHKFWKELSWDQRKIYVANNVSMSTPKRRYTDNPESRRNVSVIYHITTNNIRYQVCKKMFLSTFGLGESQVQNWVRTQSEGMSKCQEVLNESRCTINRNETNLKHLNMFFSRLNKLPSHYCRKDTSKMYLDQSVRSMVDLYKEYCKYCLELNVKTLSRTTFDKVFRENNLALYQPKKDKCDTCTRFEVSCLSEVDYKLHIEKKDRARKEKEIEKLNAKDGKCTLLMMDVQAAKVSPCLKNSSFYYKTKLTCHNFTVMNVVSKHVMCYWFCEIDTDLSASTYASLLSHYIMQYCPDDKRIVIFSDGCTAQNRNSILANALLSMSWTKNIIIEQKYLERGHTQMECDSVHANIEQKLKDSDIYLPSDYLKATLEARKNPFPYEARWVEYNEFNDYSRKESQVYNSIRPGMNFNVTDIRALQYSKGKIMYKVSFDSDWLVLPQRQLRDPTTDWPKLHENKKRIKYEKWNHLQELKEFIPTHCRQFYVDIPHECKQGNKGRKGSK